MTIEQYEQLPDTGVRTELVDGEVIELAMGNLLHTLVRDRTARELDGACKGVAAAEVEFRTIGNRVRRADAVWFAAGRLIQSDWTRSILPVPDLVVEVVSPSDRAAEVRQKVREADVWNRGHGPAIAGVDTVTADCLPGFSLPLERVFPGELEFPR